MDYINHFTLNTGHSRKSYPGEVGKDILFSLRPQIKEIISDQGICEFIDDTYLQITIDPEGDMYAATLYVDYDGDKIPVFASMATSATDKRLEIEDNIKPIRKIIGPGISYMVPEAPVIVDMILPACNLRPDLFGMTGDMSRCLAWCILDPGAI